MPSVNKARCSRSGDIQTRTNGRPVTAGDHVEFKPGEKLAGSGSDSSVCRYGSVRLDAGTLARFRAMRKPASYSATFFQPGEDQPEHSCQCAATALGRARSRNTSTSDQLKSACMSTHVDEL